MGRRVLESIGVGLAVLCASSCGGRAQTQGGSVGASGSVGAGGSVGASGSAGASAVVASCAICNVTDLLCLASPESVDLLRTTVSKTACAFEPGAGFGGPSVQIDCNTSSLVCPEAGVCPKFTLSGTNLTVLADDGGPGYKCFAGASQP